MTNLTAESIFGGLPNEMEEVMNLNEYQVKAVSTAIYPKQYQVVYPALGLAGEAGEVAEKVKKFIRDDVMNKQEVAKELGDVLWYVANLASDLGFSLEEVARMNVEKLESRKERGVLGGNGDNR